MAEDENSSRDGRGPDQFVISDDMNTANTITNNASLFAS